MIFLSLSHNGPNEKKPQVFVHGKLLSRRQAGHGRPCPFQVPSFGVRRGTFRKRLAGVPPATPAGDGVFEREPRCTLFDERCKGGDYETWDPSEVFLVSFSLPSFCAVWLVTQTQLLVKSRRGRLRALENHDEMGLYCIYVFFGLVNSCFI